MPIFLEIQFLPAEKGDSAWIRWGNGRQLLVDLGTFETGKRLAKRLEAMAPDRRAFDLLVISHVDEDHLGGAISALVKPDKPLPDVLFSDIWFNGWANLSGLQNPLSDDSRLEALGPAQGEEFSGWLQSRAWNNTFSRGPVERRGDSLRTIDLGGGLRVKVLGPTRAGLKSLVPTWRKEVTKALASGRLKESAQGIQIPSTLEPLGGRSRPVLSTKADLELLAKTPSAKDPSAANGSSIILLLEWHGRTVLLTGDAHADDVVDGLNQLKEDGPIHLDVLKVPHHGSAKNLTRDLVEAVDCPYWVFSSDGSTHRHPDPEAVARVLRWSKRQPVTLGFNVPSVYNQWWSDQQWRDKFAYTTEYGTSDDGLLIRLTPQPGTVDTDNA